MTDLTLDFLKSRHTLERMVFEAAARDPAFRTALSEEPRAAIEELIGCPLPASIEVELVRPGATTIVAVLPPEVAFDPAELDDAELAEAAGGVLSFGSLSGSSMIQDMEQQNQQYLVLQAAVQQESRSYQTLSNAIKAAHDAAMGSIQNTRA